MPKTSVGLWRHWEIGVRMALGAKRADILRLVLRHRLGMTIGGLAIGLSVSLAATSLLRNRLFGVGTSDALIYGSLAGLLFVVALVACFIPARRATNVEPMAALRCE